MREDQRPVAMWLITGVLLGAVTSGAVVYAYARPPVADTGSLVKGRIVAQCANLTLPHRVFLPLVKREELDKAFASMDADAAQRAKLQAELSDNKSRLVWLTVWDWDKVQAGDTISISSDGYKRLVTLSNHRQPIAIPEPKSGYIEVRGERSEDGIVAISLLSGSYPVALPHMTPGQTMKVEIDTIN